MAKNKNRNGFTLIEMAVGLAVLGMMIYTALAIFAERSAIDKIAVTQRKMDVIEKAIHLRFLNSDPDVDGSDDRGLPCPANGELALTHADFGKGNNGVIGICAYGPLIYGPGVSAYGGAVPTRTLNLPDSYMFDGWGRRISYIVDEKCVEGDPLSSCVGALTVKDRANNIISDKAGYILISHGKNGWGAWNRNGGTNSRNYDANMSEAEKENAHVASDGSNDLYNIIFVDDFINDETSTSAADYFDDIVRWKTKGMVDYDADRLP